MESEMMLKLDKIADQILENHREIDKILSNCTIDLNLFSSEFQNKFDEILNIDTYKLLIQNKSDEINDLKTVDTILKYLDSGKPAQHPHHRLVRSESLYSSSTSLLTTDSTTSNTNQDNIKEFMKQLSEAKAILESISNCSFNVPDISAISARATVQKSKFNDLIFSLRRLMKEMTAIASTDKKENEASLPGNINDEFLISLQHLNRVSVRFF
jgi:hypothetical protein